MATKSLNLTSFTGKGQHTATFGSSASLNDALLVAFDDTVITTNDELFQAIEAARRALTAKMSEVGDPQQFPTSGSEDF